MNLNNFVEYKGLLDGETGEIVSRLTEKSIRVPSWNKLVREYDPNLHPVMDRGLYPDIVHDDGTVEYVTRINQDMQRLAVKKTAQLCVGLPVERIYKPKTEGEALVAKLIEKIFQRNRIDNINIDRCKMLFSSCEIFTLWYSVAQEHNMYGLEDTCHLKVRCKNFAPINGDKLFPLLDKYGDMIAISVGGERFMGKQKLSYLDTYTKDLHIQFINKGEGWCETVREDIIIGKIPGVYAYRSTPIWEDISNICYEIEWALSRNGNYLRRNSKPILAIYSDQDLTFNQSTDNDSLTVQQHSPDSKIEYVTWEQATDSLKFYVEQLRQSFFSQLQLPDISFDNMKSTPMSGESRHMMFIDSELKVKEESGRLLEMFDREINVVKAFAKCILPAYSKEIDSLMVENIITPFGIRSEEDKIANIIKATGGKPILSQREGVEYLGWSDDVDKTMQELRGES